MTFTYDYLLAGATGQIGRILSIYLKAKGTIYLVDRETEVLPSARHVVNAAGYTLFNDNYEAYWNDNIRLAIRLAQHAYQTGAQYHQLSSEAVAEYRTQPMPETLYGVKAHPKMNHYALSKVLMETAVTSILPSYQTSIYRCCDVVPPWNGIKREWRRNHWLSILFAAGKAGFEPVDDFPVWIAPVDELVRALVILIHAQCGRGAFHLLGHRYTWRQFHSYAPTLKSSKYHKMLVKQVTPIVRIDPPLATCIYATITDALLAEQGFTWSLLPTEYWQEFAHYAAYKEGS